MSVLNCTLHDIVIVIDDKTVIVPPSGFNARQEMKRKLVGTTLIDGVHIPIYQVIPGEIMDLPGYVGGTILIVSRVVQDALPDRDDLYVPGILLRDDKNRIIGCMGLERSFKD